MAAPCIVVMTCIIKNTSNRCRKRYPEAVPKIFDSQINAINLTETAAVKQM